MPSDKAQPQNLDAQGLAQPAQVQPALVHVIDDDEAIRESLAFLLQTAKMAVKTYASALAFLEALPDTASSCIITDVRMPGISGVELLRRLKELNVSVPVIVVTGHGDVPLAVEAMKIGAIDFLEKPFDDEVLLASVRSALKTRDAETKRRGERSEVEARLGGLSNRERDVLHGLVAGRANKQIAYDLGISPRTVEIYRANLMNKMQAGSLSELVRMALVVGILGTE
jgi:two-component system response regulator FixJ